MTICKRKQVASGEASQYASAKDFCAVFSDDMDVFYRLAFLLNGDYETAEQCFVAGIEDCVNTNRVFKEWARNWAKRTIIEKAVRALQPRPGQHSDSCLTDCAVQINEPHPISDRDVAFSRVLALEDFERFVFVITVLEEYSEHECALLLNCSIRDVRNARVRATEQMAATESNTIEASHRSTGDQMRHGTGGAIRAVAEVERTTWLRHTL